MAAADLPDFLTLYASAQPGKLAVIDDRPGADVVAWTYAQLEAEANRLANVLASLGTVLGRSHQAGQLTPEVSREMSGRAHAVQAMGSRLTPRWKFDRR